MAADRLSLVFGALADPSHERRDDLLAALQATPGDYPGHGQTAVRTVCAFGPAADRDAMIASGVERGARDCGERVPELLTRLQGS